MVSFPARTRTGADGTLRLAIPTDMPDADVEVVVVVEPVHRASKTAVEGWPQGYFEQTYGALRDLGFERPPQGEFEERLPLESGPGA